MAKWISSVVGYVRRELEIRRARRELEGLEHRLIRDMGLHARGIDYSLRHGREACCAPAAGGNAQPANARRTAD